jgi:hypothetical protein
VRRCRALVPSERTDPQQQLVIGQGGGGVKSLNHHASFVTSSFREPRSSRVHDDSGDIHHSSFPVTIERVGGDANTLLWLAGTRMRGLADASEKLVKHFVTYLGGRTVNGVTFLAVRVGAHGHGLKFGMRPDARTARALIPGWVAMVGVASETAQRSVRSFLVLLC